MAENEQQTEQTQNKEDKVQDVGKKLSGFFGNLAEKAKQIDVKDLTERAKQKVDEVKNKAGELAAGKAENFATPREEIDPAQMKELMTKMADCLQDSFPPVAEAELSDVAEGETLLCKASFGTPSDPVFVASGKEDLFVLSKAGDQFTVSVFALKDVLSFSFLPPRKDVAGRLIVSFGKEEVKLPLTGLESYCKSLLLYKKIRSLR